MSFRFGARFVGLGDVWTVQFLFGNCNMKLVVEGYYGFDSLCGELSLKCVFFHWKSGGS